jgi:FkbM family methyltransferase
VAIIKILANRSSNSSNRATQINSSKDQEVVELSENFEKLAKTLSLRIKIVEKELEKQSERNKVYFNSSKDQKITEFPQNFEKLTKTLTLHIEKLEKELEKQNEKTNVYLNSSKDQKMTELPQNFEKLAQTLTLRIEILEKELEKLTEIKKVHLKLYDFSKEKLPVNETFDCVTMVNIYVQPILCIHDLDRDVWVSKTIKKEGIWERPMVEFFMKALQSNPAFQVFDIGAQIGQYTIYAAKLGRTSVTVEPFIDNCIRLHASALQNNLTSKIILVNNGISDRPGEVKQLRRNTENIGGQGITDTLLNPPTENSMAAAGQDKKYSLVTITLDDLVSVLPDHFNKAIMKIDIEGYEFKAFRRASKLLKRVEVQVILFEWLGKNEVAKFPDQEVEEFLNFMHSLGYVSRSFTNLDELSSKSHRSWPQDMVFVMESYYPTLKKMFI